MSILLLRPYKILPRKRTQHFERDQFITHISGELPLAGSPVAMCIRARRRGRALALDLAVCRLRVKRVISTVRRPLPIYLDKQIVSVSVGMS